MMPLVSVRPPNETLSRAELALILHTIHVQSHTVTAVTGKELRGEAVEYPSYFQLRIDCAQHILVTLLVPNPLQSTAQLAAAFILMEDAAASKLGPAQLDAAIKRTKNLSITGSPWAQQ
eukprot:CAMPEP_0178435014 /NCGR_PEP_ID=MMETSP0689_2-20121128/33713_1 /TAXON_ID=160604 /ORGANISM="Amphidinium massartii, Strain CS-259" /LENGTH=118 /DNA_ID=CAMNT_0020057081 /DNA_START=74 /DNA_END=430 /DNA_ORIENTATION=+